MDMEDTSKLKIFTGTAHPALAKEISDYIGVPLGKAICGRFNNGEIQVMINESVRGKDCFIIQPTGAPVNDNLMEMLIMVDALKRASARHITVVVPYYGYARQDRKTRGREPISAKLVADLMSTAGVTRVVTMDLHAGQIQGFFPYKFTSAFSKYCFAKLCFLIQFSFQYQPWQTNACSNCIDILICLTGTPTFIQCLCISKIYFSQT